MIAGLAIREGYLSLPLVFLCVCVGAMLGDAFFFFLGRYSGDRVLHTLPFVHRLLARP